MMKKLSVIQIQQLQQQLADNDEAALKDLYDAFADKLFHFAYAIVHSKETAEEIIEDVFIKVWQKRLHIATIENLAVYLFITTKNISCNYLRKYNRKNICLDELSLPYYYINVSPEDLLITSETLQSINKAINKLPPQCRIIFKLIKEDGLKYKDVAALLNLNIKTVENQMGIALKKLHTSIEVLLPAAKKSPLKKN
ncbi:MAG: RNA polymerase sigma-70 factor [Parafilimonas sp.]